MVFGLQRRIVAYRREEEFIVLKTAARSQAALLERHPVSHKV